MWWIGIVGCGQSAVWYVDADKDGYGEARQPRFAREAPPHTVANALDCDDHAPLVNPDAREICDEIDDDCDGFVDQADPDFDVEGLDRFWADADGDGLGNPGQWVDACAAPDGYTDNFDDCTDAWPFGLDWVNGVDDDCDGIVDVEDPTSGRSWTGIAGDEGAGGITSVDIDGDGARDLIVQLTQLPPIAGSLILWPDISGTPTGTLDDLNAQIVTSAGAVVRATPDLTGNGGEDLVITQVEHRTGTLGTLAGESLELLGRVRCGHCVVGEAGDFDGDGTLEWPVFDDSETLLVLHTLPTTGTDLAVELRDLDGEQYRWPVYPMVPMMVGDFDADGRDDLVTVGWDAVSLTWGRDLSGTPVTLRGYAVDAAVGDLNGDGFTDLAIRSDRVDLVGVGVWFGGPVLHWNNDDPDLLVEGLSGSIVIGDLDGDGFDDLAGTIDDTAVGVVRGDASFLPVESDLDLLVTPFPGFVGSRFGGDVLHLEDLNDDDRADLVVVYNGPEEGGVVVFSGSATAEHLSARDLAERIPAAW